MISIKQYPPEIEIATTGSDSGSCLLLEPSQRQLLAWFAREKPEMMREAIGVDKVIEELERRIKNPASKPFETHSHECDIVGAAYASAIALLKGEVRK
jgi:hypothetical protein